MSAELGEQAVQVMLRASAVTLSVLLQAAQAAVQRHIVLAGGLKDKNGPALQSGIWQIVGGGLIIAAAAFFATINPDDSEQVEAAYKAIEAAIYGTWQGTYDEYISENTVYWQFVFNRDGTYSFNDDSGNNETGTFVLGRNTGEASYISNMTLTPKDREAYTLNFTMTGNPINGLRFDSYGAERSYPTFVKK